MFVGHYAAAIAAKSVEPKAPFWALIAGAQLVDIAWAGLIIVGVEHGRVDPGLPGSTLVLDHMPWTHSLPAALVWALAATLLAKPLLRLGWPAALAIGATVFSHWLLDLLVHRPDLAVYPGGPKVGLGLWDYPVVEQTVEIGLIAIAAVFWTSTRIRAGYSAWPAAAFLTLLIAVQIIGMLLPAVASASLAETGPSALVTYLVITIAAALTERTPRRRGAMPQPGL